MPSVSRREVFTPVLLSSPPLEITLEQKEYIYNILSVSCSDSKFADKAYQAVMHVLTAGPAPVPVVSSLSPSSAVLGSPSFDLHVLGSQFSPTSVIVFAGHDEPTFFVSDGELTTGVDMSVWNGPDALPVCVRNADGVTSDPLLFTFTVAATRMVEKKESVKESHLGTKEVKK